jgi:hypothetical protein
VPRTLDRLFQARVPGGRVQRMVQAHGCRAGKAQGSPVCTVERMNLDWLWRLIKNRGLTWWAGYHLLTRQVAATLRRHAQTARAIRDLTRQPILLTTGDDRTIENVGMKKTKKPWFLINSCASMLQVQ